MNNNNPFKGIAIFLSLVLAVLGIYAFQKYLDYRNDQQYFYTDTEKTETIQSHNPEVSEKSSQTESTELSAADTKEIIDASLLWDYSQKWGYNCLSKEEKELYVRICEAVKKEKPALNARGLFIKKENLDKIVEAVKNDNPQFLNFYDEIGCVYNAADSYMTSIKIKYRKRTGGDLLEAAAGEILSQAEKQPTDYLKIKYVHDVLINNCSYNQRPSSGSPDYSAAGPIVYKTGVCEDYSKAFCYLVQSMGIPCFCVPGTATNSSGQTEGHMWNMVKLEGDWYNIDVTWDDPVTTSGEDVLRYDYFLIGDGFYNDHTPDTGIELPVTTNNYKILTEV